MWKGALWFALGGIGAYVQMIVLLGVLIESGVIRKHDLTWTYSYCISVPKEMKK